MAIELETDDLLPPLHPGEILRQEFTVPLALTAYAVAKACGVPRTRIERIVREETPVTADTALRLGRCFGMNPQVWINLQGDHDLRCAQRRIGAAIDRIRPPAREAA
ncbi:HigA family addiction module antitoxin [Methylobacterium nonmethylotrophicum]|uniref:Addiction module antidote protein, HigA family n=1 Tax=Methylobacterium nonmethylotrophicum TaxID=1141884 RepID=A0A4Z0NN39_9HYPH|nr:HigA family addiction module antitoxin [Methylobacterium nonmethylotrophicum]TGD98045.1 addiction module antidote protein, HigA family [Methylobacterium nonmethylotrophicum]